MQYNEKIVIVPSVLHRSSQLPSKASYPNPLRLARRRHVLTRGLHDSEAKLRSVGLTGHNVPTDAGDNLLDFSEWRSVFG
jgi:hypothetical protein